MNISKVFTVDKI